MEEKRMTLNQKITNYWYHYKWPTIAVAVFLIIIGMSTYQMVTKTEPDAMIMYAGRKDLSPNVYMSLEQYFSEIMTEDSNGDGKKSTDIVEIVFDFFDEDGNIISAYSPTERTDRMKRFEIEISVGQSVIYVIDKAIYPSVEGLLVPLSEVLGYTPDNAYDEYCIELKNIPAYKTTSLMYMTGEELVCVRKLREKNILSSNEDADFYNSNLSFFNDFVNAQ